MYTHAAMKAQNNSLHVALAMFRLSRTQLTCKGTPPLVQHLPLLVSGAIVEAIPQCTIPHCIGSVAQCYQLLDIMLGLLDIVVPSYLESASIALRSKALGLSAMPR